MSLHNYGIQNEESDFRIHICVEAKRLYLYETQSGLNSINWRVKNVKGYQPGIKENTSLGFLVKPEEIEGCKSWRINENLFIRSKMSTAKSTTEKGIAAERIAYLFMKKWGWKPVRITDKQEQIKGYDFMTNNNKKVQVKCDYKGGEGGTGNLFIQTHESNPTRAT
jgi:hypothetical protein